MSLTRIIIRRSLGWMALLLMSGDLFAQGLPYTATISAEQTTAWSGPSQTDHYPTEKLAVGQQVEVYREQNDWLAIRPTKTAFTWVDGRDITVVNRETGIVKVPTMAWIGSQFVERRDQTQVQLKINEPIELLEVVQTNNGTWYKIAPPAGEFRYVPGSAVRRSGPTLNAPSANNEVPQPGVISKWQPANPYRPRPEEPVVTNQVQLLTTQPSSTVNVSRQPWTTEPIQPPASTTTSSTSTTAAIPESAPSSTQPSRVQALSSASLDQLEADLSVILLEQPQYWNLSGMNERADQLLAQSQSTVERGNIRLFQSKLAKLSDIRQRAITQQALIAQQAKQGIYSAPGLAANRPATSAYPLSPRNTSYVPQYSPTSLPLAQSAVAATPAGMAMRAATAANGAMNGTPPNLANIAPVPLPNLTGPAGTSNERVEAELGRYDSIGVLLPVESQRANAPKYALTIGKQVIAYVNPGPGVDLNLYKGQQVGIVGARQKIVELPAPLLTANQIGPVDPAVIARLRDQQPRFR